MRAIEKAKNEMGFSVEEEEQFKGLWDSAKMDDVSGEESLIVCVERSDDV